MVTEFYMLYIISISKMDSLELKMYDSKIEEARWQGYCAGKRTMQRWALNCEKHMREEE